MVTNPPFSRNVVLRSIRLQELVTSQSGPTPATNIFSYQYDSGLPSSFQWNGGVQMALPFASALDVWYVGQHAWNQLGRTDPNSIDLGTAFLAQNQDPTLPATTNGTAAFTTDLLARIAGTAASTIRRPTSGAPTIRSSRR